MTTATATQTARVSSRTVIHWHYSTDPRGIGYGTADERAAASRRFADSEPDAVGTVATLPARIQEVIRSAGLNGGVYYRQELRIRDGKGWRPATRDEIDALDSLALEDFISMFAGKRQAS